MALAVIAALAWIAAIAEITCGRRYPRTAALITFTCGTTSLLIAIGTLT